MDEGSGNGSILRCSFCGAEVSQLYHPDARAEGICEVCMNTAPHAWRNDPRMATLAEHHLVVVAAQNWNTNAVLADVAKLTGLALGASTAHLEMEAQLGRLRADVAALRDEQYDHLKDVGVTLGEAFRALRVDVGNLKAMMGADRIERTASGQVKVTDEDRRQVREVLARVAEKHKLCRPLDPHAGFPAVMYADLVYGMSELVAEARAGR